MKKTNPYLLYNLFELFKNEKKNEEGTLLSSTSASLDPYGYHVSKSGRISFMKLEIEKRHSIYVIFCNNDDTSQENLDNENE